MRQALRLLTQSFVQRLQEALFHARESRRGWGWGGKGGGCCLRFSLITQQNLHSRTEGSGGSHRGCAPTCRTGASCPPASATRMPARPLLTRRWEPTQAPHRLQEAGGQLSEEACTPGPSAASLPGAQSSLCHPRPLSTEPLSDKPSPER